MVYSQLLAGQPSADRIAEVANHYICAKDVGKYATMVVLKLSRNGVLDYINCGHIHPLLCSPSGVRYLDTSNFPVGLIEEAEFRSDTVHIEPGSRILLVTDGVTEAENVTGEFYGDDRLEDAAVCSNSLEAIFETRPAFLRTRACQRRLHHARNPVSEPTPDPSRRGLALD